MKNQQPITVMAVSSSSVASEYTRQYFTGAQIAVRRIRMQVGLWHGLG